MKEREYGEGWLFQRPDSSRWCIGYWVDGVQYRESSGSTDRRVAEALLKRRIAEKRADHYGLATFIGPQRVLLAELLDSLEMDYRIQGRRSLSQLHYHLRTVRRVLEGARAVDVDAARLRRYVQQRLDEGAANATINRELAAIKRALNMAARDGLLQSVPHFPHLREDNARQGFFEAHEVRLLLMHLPNYLQDLTRFAYLTGWRKAEILGLRWEMVDMQAGVIRLQRSKNGRGRVLVLTGELLALIQRREAERTVGLRQAEFVFYRYGVPIRSFKEAWKVTVRQAGLQGKVFHDLRRTAVRNLVRAGVREKVVMDLTGHRTRSIFDRYNITSPDDLREAAQKLDIFLKEGSKCHADESCAIRDIEASGPLYRVPDRFGAARADTL